MAIEEVKFSLMDCLTCGVVFQITTNLEARRRRDGKTFYCPNGHTLAWELGETAEQKLARVTRALAEERSARVLAQAALHRAKSRLKKAGAK